MKLIKLNCPACAGALEVPDNLTVAHCVYCGNKILLEHEGAVQERRDLERYQELCRVAVDAKNHNEVIRYCNLILEIDPKKIQAWIDKANATFWLTTSSNNRYDEAMEYLNRASQIAPNDNSISDAQVALTKYQAQWHQHLSVEYWRAALKVYYIYYEESNPSSHRYAALKSRDNAIKAMNHVLIASNYEPANIDFLEGIEEIAKKYDVVEWHENIHRELTILALLREKKNAEASLPQTKAQLNQARDTLERLRGQKGLFIGGKIREAEHRVRELQDKVSKLEQSARLVPLKSLDP